MPVAVARQIQFWLDELGVDVDVSLEPLVLTHDQCVAYELPRTPIKDDDKRGPGFEAKYGEGATELDALEALYPGELARIIRQGIAPYRDPELRARLAWAQYQEAQPLLDEAWGATDGPELERRMEELIEQANAITAEQAERIQAIMEETRERLQPFVEAADELGEQAARIKRDIDVELPERPEPVIAGPDDATLFDSRRNWLEQLDAFKKWQRGAA
jgi:hypothetical protein